MDIDLLFLLKGEPRLIVGLVVCLLREQPVLELLGLLLQWVVQIILELGNRKVNVFGIVFDVLVHYALGVVWRHDDARVALLIKGGIAHELFVGR